MLFPVLQCVTIDTVSSTGECQSVGQIDRLFQAKFLDQTEQVSLFEFDLKKKKPASQYASILLISTKISLHLIFLLS